MATSPPWDYIAKLVCIGDSACGKSSLTIRLCEGRFCAHHDVTIGVEFGSRIVPVGPPHSTSPESLLAAGGGDQPAPAGLPSPRMQPAGSSSQKDQQQRRQKHMKLSLWDTAGQETYKSVTRSYFRGASGALLVFDLCRRSTFLHATDWLADLRGIAEEGIVVVLVGNKADLTQGDDDDGDQVEEGAERFEGDGDGANASKAGRRRREVTRREAEEWARRNGVLEYVETSAKSGENVERAFMRVAERIYDNIQAGKYDLNDRRSGVKVPRATGRSSVRLSQDPKGRQQQGTTCC